jgi:hypothetical protein
MNEAHANALLSVLEGQRNEALNALANAKATLIAAGSRITELETKLAEATKPATQEPA